MDRDFLDRLASADPAPGGGAATAVLVAMGAALIGMVCRLTIGRPRFQASEEALRAVLAEADRGRARALALAAEDAAAYGAVVAARALPRDTEPDRRARKAALQDALRGATEVPLETLGLAEAMARAVAGASGRVNPSAASDLVVAAHSVGAGLEGAYLNVRSNLALIDDAGYVEASRARAEALLADGRDAVRRSVGAADGA